MKHAHGPYALGLQLDATSQHCAVLQPRVLYCWSEGQDDDMEAEGCKIGGNVFLGQQSCPEEVGESIDHIEVQRRNVLAAFGGVISR